MMKDFYAKGPVKLGKWCDETKCLDGKTLKDFSREIISSSEGQCLGVDFSGEKSLSSTTS